MAGSLASYSLSLRLMSIPGRTEQHVHIKRVLVVVEILLLVFYFRAAYSRVSAAGQAVILYQGFCSAGDGPGTGTFQVHSRTNRGGPEPRGVLSLRKLSYRMAPPAIMAPPAEPLHQPLLEFLVG